MALKKPLVISSTTGVPEQLQAADTLNIVGFGGTSIISQTNDSSGTIVCGSPVYNDAADGVKLAKADATGTSKVIGLVYDATIATTVAGNIAIGGILSLTTTQWDAAFGTTGGLAFGTDYFLSDATAGDGSSTVPSTVGHLVVHLGRGISTTELLIQIGQPILL